MVDPANSSKSLYGDKRQGGQRYQNSFVYKNNDPAKQKIAQLPARGLCKRCRDIIDWRKKFGKYKPLTQKKTCLSCHQRSITDAYHVLCLACAAAKDVCAKCQQNEQVLPP
ncbi:hypothetical protein SeLEV6574_g05637 [Synchytrium endobioticum]|nr:hypothetical protein SeLEV6574_g05637 [Synchytrium endobioticum]